jgi:hypothetical protein
MRAAPATLLLTLAAIASAAVACSAGSTRRDTVEVGGQSVPASQLAGIDRAVCQAAAQASGDPGAAGHTFLGQAHDGIHLIARGLQAVDRKASADLLVAKYAVEADITDKAPGAKLAGDLVRLAAATRSGLDRLGVSVDSCPAD